MSVGVTLIRFQLHTLIRNLVRYWFRKRYNLITIRKNHYLTNKYFSSRGFKYDGCGESRELHKRMKENVNFTLGLLIP